MKLFAIVHRSVGDNAALFEGMDQAAVGQMIQDQGATVDFVTESAWNDFVSVHQPVPLTPAEKLALIHSLAASLAVSGADPITTLQRSAALVIMDELNILRQRDVDRAADVAAATSLADLKTRWAVRAAFAQRTASQIQAAIQAKTNSGAGD